MDVAPSDPTNFQIGIYFVSGSSLILQNSGTISISSTGPQFFTFSTSPTDNRVFIPAGTAFYVGILPMGNAPFTSGAGSFAASGGATTSIWTLLCDTPGIPTAPDFDAANSYVAIDAAGATNKTFTKTGGHSFTNGTPVFLSSLYPTTGTGLSTTTVYYIINSTGTTFQLASTLGGTAVSVSASVVLNVNQIYSSLQSPVTTTNANPSPLVLNHTAYPIVIIKS
jgi:hypothetical protein